MPQRRGTWRQRLQVLERNVGHGVLSGQFVVDQRYAAYQHVHETLQHPRGGGPNYVSIPLEARHREWYRGIAAGLLDGSSPVRMADAMADLDSQVRILAPVDENDLRRSGAYTVTSDGAVVIQRAPDVPRLTDAELRAKSARRGAR
jgi:hypothetical protein